MATKRKPAPRDEPITISDPRAIKALAHPARLAVLEELHLGGQLTATECAEIVGMSASAMSYHLRALAKWGFVERAPADGDGRERPWRAASSGGWRVESTATPVAMAAESAVVGASFDRMRALLTAWAAVEADQPAEWRDVATLSNTLAWLTAGEARELIDQHQAFADRVRGRTTRDRPPGSRRVRLGQLLVPAVEG